VFRYGIATGRCERNPAPDLHGALRPIVVKHMAAVLDPTGVSALMRAIATCEGQPLTRAALELSAVMFQRPGNIRQMDWAEFNLDGGLWTIPPAKMKRTVHGKVNGRPHRERAQQQGLPGIDRLPMPAISLRRGSPDTER
jgi:integrase